MQSCIWQAASLCFYHSFLNLDFKLMSFWRRQSLTGQEQAQQYSKWDAQYGQLKYFSIKAEMADESCFFVSYNFTYQAYKSYFLSILALMRRKNRQSEDLESLDNSSLNSEQPQTKSFMVGGGQKMVSLTFPDVELKKKQTYKKQPYCVICLRNFTNFFRQHHCRVCANAVCSDCSRSLINKQRACDLCILHYTNPHQQKKKKQILTTLQTLCAYLIYRRNIKMSELQALKSGDGQDRQSLLNEIQLQGKQIKELQTQNSHYKEQKQMLQAQLQKIRQANAQIQQSISQIERQIGTDNLDEYA